MFNKLINKFKTKTMKLKDLIVSVDAFNVLISTNKELSALTRYKLDKLSNAMNVELKSYQEINNDKIKEYGTAFTSEGGEESFQVKADSENFPKYKEEMETLLEKDLDIKIPEIKESELEKAIDKDTLEYLKQDISWLIK